MYSCLHQFRNKFCVTRSHKQWIDYVAKKTFGNFPECITKSKINISLRLHLYNQSLLLYKFLHCYCIGMQVFDVCHQEITQCVVYFHCMEVKGNTYCKTHAMIFHNIWCHLILGMEIEDNFFKVIIQYFLVL